MQTRLASHRIALTQRSFSKCPLSAARRTGRVHSRPAQQSYQNSRSARRRGVIACSSDSSSPAQPGDGEDAADAPSTSYLLPWEAEPPPPPPNYASIQANLGAMDTNQLQTALSVAIAAEDYQLATRIKERLHTKLVESGSAVISRPMDWRALGVPEWLADRAERLGFLFPTEVQRRAAPVILSGADCVIASQTGSGKTAAFLVPALCQLDYPPELFPEDLEGPQLLLLVPSFELGVQACMLLYKLWGGNISSRTPGDPANMFSYTGPPGIKVRGVLNDEEVQMAVADGRYLRGVHALVATPDMALALHSLPNSPLSFQDLRAVVVDEVDALLDAYPASFGQLLDAAVHRHVPPGFQQGPAGLTAVGLDLENPEPQNPDDAGSSSSSSSVSGKDSSSGKQEGPGGQDNLAKLKALLSEQQQQRKSPQQAGSPAAGAGSPAAAAGSSASLSAAAARLEGLLAAPAAMPAGEGADAAADQQQQQQEGASGSAAEQQGQGADASISSSSSSELEDMAAQIPADYDDPMPKPQVVLVGATVGDEDLTLAVNRGWVSEPVVVRVGAEGSVPAGLKHRAIVVSQEQQRLGGLVASLRRDLTGALAAADAAAEAAATANSNAAAAAAADASKQQPVRVIIFARSEQEARTAAEPLRAALWGDHMLSVLLPSTGAEPVKAITAFRDRVASLLLATPTAARGLDLPAVSHVYSLGLPQDATEYVHRAGRAGRIGSTAGGEIVTVVTRDEVPLLLQMVSEELGLHVDVLELDKQPAGGLGLLGTDFDAARQELLSAGAEGEGAADGDGEGQQGQQGQSEEKLEAARKGLEDLFNLM